MGGAKTHTTPWNNLNLHNSLLQLQLAVGSSLRPSEYARRYHVNVRIIDWGSAMLLDWNMFPICAEHPHQFHSSLRSPEPAHCL